MTEASPDALTLRESLRAGGSSTVAICAGLALVDEFDQAVLGVFAPEIQRALGVSTTGLAAIATTAGAVFVAGSVPIARLADRSSRRRIVVVATLVWAAALASLSVVANLFQFVVARIVGGIGKSNSLPVHGSLLADAYPERARGAIYALHGASAPLGRVVAPLSIAAVSLAVTGEDAWRTVAVLAALPPLAMAVVSGLFLVDPERGGQERARLLGAAPTVSQAPPQVSISMAFARIRRIATFDRIATGVGVIGFTIFTVPIFVSLVLEQRFGLDAAGRSLVTTAAAAASLVAVPVGAGIGGRLFARDPAALLRLMGVAVVASSLCTAIAVFLPSTLWLTVAFAVGSAIGSAGFVMLFVVIAAVVPPDLRAQGFSLIGVYVFLIGGFFGSIVAGIVADSVGTRAAIPTVLLPAAALGGALIVRAGATVEADMANVEADVREAADEAARRAATGEVAVLQVRGLRVSIGPVPILHGIDLDVAEREIVAIVGTNGSGKSTLLRAISGLVVPERGVIRFGPTDVTLHAAHARARAGIVQLSGGRSGFGDLTVRENLDLAAVRLDADERERRVADALELFPELDLLLDRRGTDLSGGEQQIVGLARALVVGPKLFLIDELSLGLAPVVVGRLVEALQQIRDAGTAIVIVEQSLNVAAVAADRVVFLDRGEVRFEGSAAELGERRDLARSVFLGTSSSAGPSSAEPV